MSKEAIVHFSGGSDSTLAAALLARTCTKVHLLSFDRLSFIGAKNYTEHNYKKLVQVFGKDKFVRKVVSYEKWHKRLCYERYFYFAFKYKLASTLMSFSKLAMYWYSAVYARKNNISIVADGMVPYMDIYPDQNSAISIDSLRAFFSSFKIDYQNPIFHQSMNVEQTLYDLGINDQPLVRGTKDDKQIFYAEQVVFALFVKYFVKIHGMKKYEEVVGNLYKEKIEYMKNSILKGDFNG